MGLGELGAARQGRLPRLRGPRQGRGRQPVPHRDEGRRPLRPRCACGGYPCCPSPPVSARRSTARHRHGRAGVRGADRRGRGVLLVDHADRDAAGGSDGRATGAGRDALGQAAVLVRPRSVARGAPRQPAAGVRRRGRQEPELVPHDQRRRHLDARHLGVPLVRVVGSRLPHRRPGDGRHRRRQGAARTDAARALPPPERAAPGVRVELQRRQPAGPRVGDAGRVRG